MLKINFNLSWIIWDSLTINVVVSVNCPFVWLQNDLRDEPQGMSVGYCVDCVHWDEKTSPLCVTQSSRWDPTLRTLRKITHHCLSSSWLWDASSYHDFEFFAMMEYSLELWSKKETFFYHSNKKKKTKTICSFLLKISRDRYNEIECTVFFSSLQNLHFMSLKNVASEIILFTQKYFNL